ncbi:MAG: transketolase [Negativicutes bacterium]|nr:transketolase [Negativicutes bacterium]
MSNVGNINYRSMIVNSLIPFARKDERIYLLVCDMGFGVTDSFRSEFPDRMLNTGIMEQGTVGIAAGIAMTGLIPVVYSMVNFLTFRAIEQIRNDIIYQNLNVKFIATGVNNYFSFLGHSHCCGQDDKKIMQLVSMKVFDPYQVDVDFDKMVEDWITDKQAGYIRV